MARRSSTSRRAPARRPAEPSIGQFNLFGSEEPWEPTSGCHHCRACDTCQDCGRCAGRGCQCACEDDEDV